MPVVCPASHQWAAELSLGPTSPGQRHCRALKSWSLPLFHVSTSAHAPGEQGHPRTPVLLQYSQLTQLEQGASMTLLSSTRLLTYCRCLKSPSGGFSVALFIERVLCACPGANKATERWGLRKDLRDGSGEAVLAQHRNNLSASKNCPTVDEPLRIFSTALENVFFDQGSSYLSHKAWKCTLRAPCLQCNTD